MFTPLGHVHSTGAQTVCVGQKSQGEIILSFLGISWYFMVICTFQKKYDGNLLGLYWAE